MKVEILESVRLEREDDARSATLGPNETRPLEHPKVVGQRGLREVERRRDFARRERPRAQALQDGAARGIGERFERTPLGFHSTII